MRLIDADALIKVVNGLPTIQDHPYDMVMLSKDLVVKVIKCQPIVTNVIKNKWNSGVPDKDGYYLVWLDDRWSDDEYVMFLTYCKQDNVWWLLDNIDGTVIRTYSVEDVPYWAEVNEPED